ncbi:MoxR family ATPase [Streptomyces sp. ME02-8801-2C]|uniref:AAA family ATPase n=1 Tax=Streptomyces sp. ME02-8801-2C TaxID=3028680 RepID=UPI0029A15DA5|nr:MoxR family ATPase [Streptomyces sp. ME02-8801-2C]MDX3454535.1 MoxR family ATPase [Streptomyces sp. ME02-8801-2C]
MPDEGPARTERDGSPRLFDSPDRRDGHVYVMLDDVSLAVRVALATGRPLLLRGDPGSGKSSLAPSIALRRGWRYYEHVVTSRTQATDLLWTYDHVRRLSDAQVRAPGHPLVDHRYVTPGPLWWAFAPRSAARADDPRPDRRHREDPFHKINETRSPHHAVVLIDEIDKAEPDMPNSLLVPLGSNEFTVAETGEQVRKERASSAAGDAENRHLVIITTNEERELPQAFLRRCVVAWLPQPDSGRLVRIAQEHFTQYDGGFTETDRELAEKLAEELKNARATAKKQGLRPPSTAEYLDALRACRSIGISPDDERWDLLQRLVLLKPQQPDE